MDPGETPSYSAVSPGFKLFAYDTIVVIGGLRVKIACIRSSQWFKGFKPDVKV